MIYDCRFRIHFAWFAYLAFASADFSRFPLSVCIGVHLRFPAKNLRVLSVLRGSRAAVRSRLEICEDWRRLRISRDWFHTKPQSHKGRSHFASVLLRGRPVVRPRPPSPVLRPYAQRPASSNIPLFQHSGIWLGVSGA